jgi:hypothetical protein
MLANVSDVLAGRRARAHDPPGWQLAVKGGALAVLKRSLAGVWWGACWARGLGIPRSQSPAGDRNPFLTLAISWGIPRPRRSHVWIESRSLRRMKPLHILPSTLALLVYLLPIASSRFLVYCLLTLCPNARKTSAARRDVTISLGDFVILNISNHSSGGSGTSWWFTCTAGSSGFPRTRAPMKPLTHSPSMARFLWYLQPMLIRLSRASFTCIRQPDFLMILINSCSVKVSVVRNVMSTSSAMFVVSHALGLSASKSSPCSSNLSPVSS